MSKCFQYATNDTKACVGLTINLHQRMAIYFAKDRHIDQEKWQRTHKSGRKLVCTWTMSTKVENSSEDEICFKSNFVS